MKYDERACHFNMDTGCVELLLRDGRKISIDCTGVEDALDVTIAQRSELDYLVYALQGFSKGVPSLIISAARQVIVLLPLAYVLGNAIGIYGIWWSFLISETVTVVFALFHLAGTEKKELERIAPVL